MAGRLRGEAGGMGGAVLTGDVWGVWTHASRWLISEPSPFGVGNGGLPLGCHQSF